MPVDKEYKRWFEEQFKKSDPNNEIVTIDNDNDTIRYSANMQSDESLVKDQNPEEYVHALYACLLCGDYKYSVEKLYHEQHFKRGSSGAKDDESDFLLYDDDNLPYALIELKPYDLYKQKSIEDRAIKYQLFATAPLAKNPQILVYGTIEPGKNDATLTAKCIDYTQYKSYDSWVEAGAPFSTEFPSDYQDINYEPFICGGNKDLKNDCKQADFRAVAASFHSEFFGEHPDNSLFENLVKCLLAKIYDERTRKNGEPYQFQVEHRLGKTESSSRVFEKVNSLYKNAYTRYIDPSPTSQDEIDPKDFSEDKVKEVVLALQGMSITRGAALNGDIIGAFFEEILRVGFKQDKGMYFTHSNLVKFMISAIGLEELTINTWKTATHPENRLPYVIDPACGSGTFLLHAMPTITEAIKNNEDVLVQDFEAKQFYNARMSDDTPNYWAENFIYGFDPKFVMAITAKVNMVLHGDGSAHIFKYDAFSPFSKYTDTKLRVVNNTSRSVSLDTYSKEMCETFDVVLSNPPFGITLSNETVLKLGHTFEMPNTSTSEALFIERCFQLLKPKGRLGLVLPESILNSADNMAVRLFLYRMFNIKAIVSLPRNMFIDTPTLTSLLFAQKKTGKEIESWDVEWKHNLSYAEKVIKDAKLCVSIKNKNKYDNAEEVETEILNRLSLILDINEWVVKKGKNADIMPFKLKKVDITTEEALRYYDELLKSASIKKFIERYAFAKTAAMHNSGYYTYQVEEVGYKLSKRKEKPRPNQLCRFEEKRSNRLVNNLHLCDKEILIKIDTNKPTTVLDYMKKEVKWDE